MRPTQRQIDEVLRLASKIEKYRSELVKHLGLARIPTSFADLSRQQVEKL
jgi:hypothetical protein